MQYVFVALLVLWIVARLLRFVSKSAQKTMRRNRCAFCGVRLKTAPSRIGFATTCKKCGRTQPWVTTAEPTAASLPPVDVARAPGAWHADPLCRHELRYWDGRHWTELVKDDGYPSSDPLR